MIEESNLLVGFLFGWLVFFGLGFSLLHSAFHSGGSDFSFSAFIICDVYNEEREISS